MKIAYSPAASGELDDIYDYNKRTYSAGHAVDYVLFLQDHIDTLTAEPYLGDPVEGFPDRRALTIRRSSRGHGHIAVYRVEDATQTIRVLHIFHTAQDVLGRMESE